MDQGLMGGFLMKEKLKMNPHIKAFLEEFSHYPEKPDVFTKENINLKWFPVQGNPDETWTLLELAVCFRHNHLEAINEMIRLGATLTDNVIVRTRTEYIHILLEAGLDPNRRVGSNSVMSYMFFRGATFDEMCLLIDYGGKTPKRWRNIINAPRLREIEYYIPLSDARVSRCRRTLTSIFISCKSSSSFKSLKGPILEILKGMWCEQRGPDGCGPRSHGWSNQLKDKRVSL